MLSQCENDHLPIRISNILKNLNTIVYLYFPYFLIFSAIRQSTLINKVKRTQRHTFSKIVNSFMWHISHRISHRTFDFFFNLRFE